MIGVASKDEPWTESKLQMGAHMNFILRLLLVLAIPSALWADEPQSHTEPRADLGSAIEKLATSLDRLTVLLEKDVASRAEDKEARRVEVAVGVIGFRYRKIERFETEMRQVSRDEEHIADEITHMREAAEQYGRQERAENGQLNSDVKDAIANMELQIRLGEDRIARLRERKLVLQNDIVAEQRRLSTVEAVLDAWVESQ